VECATSNALKRLMKGSTVEDDERKHCGGGCKEALWRRMQGSTVEEDARKHCGGGCKEALWRRMQGSIVEEEERTSTVLPCILLPLNFQSSP
jgi:sugar (pentulose or hexulose) kinase